jgi:hypothetical protein
MGSDEQRFGHLVGAVLDGDFVDWTAAELEGGTVGRLAKHLKIVEAVSAAHRQNAVPAVDRLATLESSLPSSPDLVVV